MQLNSYEFILILFPITLFLYFTVGRIHINCKKIILIASGLALFGYAGTEGLVILIVSMVVNYYLCEIMLEKKFLLKPVMIATVAINAIALLVFKYADFAINSINVFTGSEIEFLELALPLGISFFTFQQIAYVVDLYHGKIEGVNLLDYAAYILYFPKIIMGPIVDPVKMIDQINDGSTCRWNWDNFISGLKMFSFGLFKKMVIADTFAVAVSWGMSNYEIATSLDLIIVMLSYTFQIYFDFSGYSDMAIGASLMLNIELPQNFDSPYKALSVRDFWNRWHLSLTSFFTKYIYIPLGGSRKGKIRTYLNVFIVFFVSGIWHGANWTFILWGLIYGILSVLDRVVEPLWNKLFKTVRWIITFIVTNILWLLFSANSIDQWIYMLKKIFFGFDFSFSTALSFCFKGSEVTYFNSKINSFLDALNLNALKAFNTRYGILEYGILWMVLFIVGSLLSCVFLKNNYELRRKNNALFMVLAALAFAWSFLFLGSESVFIYNYF